MDKGLFSRELFQILKFCQYHKYYKKSDVYPIRNEVNGLCLNFVGQIQKFRNYNIVHK